MEWSGHICHRSECRRTGFRPRQSPGGRQGCLWHHRGAQGLPFPFPSPSLGPSLTQPHILTHPGRLRPGLRLWGRDVALPAQQDPLLFAFSCLGV